MNSPDYTLVASFKDALKRDDIAYEEAWLEQHRDSIVCVPMDDPCFCSCMLIFIPVKPMGFSCFRTSNCNTGEYIGFFYPQHIFPLASGGEKLVQILKDWECGEINGRTS